MEFKVLFKAIGGILLTVFTVSAIFKAGQLTPEYWYLVYLIAFFSVVLAAYLGARKFKDTDGEEGIVVYLNYYDVFKCLSIFLIPLIVIYLGSMFKQAEAAKIFSILYAVIMILHVSYISAKHNKVSAMPVVLISKLSLSIIWVYALYETLNPSGKTYKDRRGSRTIAVMVMMIITPIVNMLVLGNDGKELIQSRLKGRSFKGASNMRAMMK